MRWIIEKVVDRLTSLFAAFFAAKVETSLILEHADHLDQLEERARRLESEGKVDLAAAVRALAGKISLENPASSASVTLQNLAADGAVPNLGLTDGTEPGRTRATSRALPKKNSETNTAP